MLRISSIYIYPIKSLGGIALNQTRLTRQGLQYDRRWMLVDENNTFLTQREHPQMALLKTSFQDGKLTVYHSTNCSNKIELSLQPNLTVYSKVNVWNDIVEVTIADKWINEWFSDNLSLPCKAVYMPETTEREVDPEYARETDIVSFADGYPILLIGQESLDDLNSRLEVPLPMNRFRPNLVFTGGAPYQEDKMKHFRIRGNNLYGVKLCGRCAITTTNQETGDRGKEPLKTLAKYRTIGGNVCFGQNIVYNGDGTISIGDEIIIVE